MYQKLPPSSVNMAGVPEMNLFAEGGALVSDIDLTSPAEIAAVLNQYFKVDSEEMEGETINLDVSCELTSAGALSVLQVVAAHNPAYGAPLEDATTKALETFHSMQHAGQNNTEEDADACLWYGTCDVHDDALSSICPGIFTDDPNTYWKDWIGFVCVCVHPDKRTVSYLIGADSD